MGSTSYWQTQLPLRGPANALTGERQADVAVIGAGITGVATAYWLSRMGASVAVLEARRVAAGASGRNGGFLLGGTAELYGEAVDHFGADKARRIWALGEENRNLASELALELQEAGIDCGYRVQGSLRLASTEDELRRILASVDLLHADGFRAEVVNQVALPQRLQSTYLGGSFHELDGEIQPARFVSGLMTLAERQGALLFDESPVHSVEHENDLYVLRTDAGVLRAPWLVLATNAWLPEFGPLLQVESLARAIKPTRGQMLVTEPVSAFVCAYPCYADEGYQYWRQLPDGRLVVGGWRNTSFATEDTLDETPAEPVQGQLDTFVHTTLGLDGVAITDRWAGVMAFTHDGLPMVGRVPGFDHCLIAGGYTGHGNGYAVVCAQALARVVRDPSDPPEAIALFNPGRILTPPASDAGAIEQVP